MRLSQLWAYSKANSGTHRRKSSKRRKKRIAIALLVSLLLGAVLDYWTFPLYAAPSGPAVNRGDNGIWLRYTWYFGQYGNRDLKNLAQRMERHEIREAFFHVRGIDKDGRLHFRYFEQARALNRGLKALSPSVHRIAWIYAGNPRGEGQVDLTSAAVRSNMAREAAWLVRDCGFDGVQWDYEICSDGDPNFLKLLEETRAALPRGSTLQAAVPTWYPAPISNQGWSTAYYEEVAQRSDGLAVMAYDSATYMPRLYVWWVQRQVERVTTAVAFSNPSCKVWIGLPTYKNGTPSHNPRAENLRMGLIGVRDGLRLADLRPWAGVALFADYTTSDEDWQQFDRLWPAAN